MVARYCDPSAVTDGSGTSQLTPWNTFVGKTLNSGDQVWIRRSGYVTLTSSFSFPLGVGFYGWPKASDPNLQIANDGATGMPPADPLNWTADVNDYAEVRATSNTVAVTLNPALIIPPTGGNTGLSYFRLKFNNTAGTAPAVPWVDVQGTGLSTTYIANCLFTAHGSSYVIESATAMVCSFVSCIFEVLGGTYPALNLGRAFGSEAGTDFKFQSCTFRDDASHSGQSLVVVTQADYTETAFYGCTFTVLGDSCAVEVNQSASLTSLGYEAKTALSDCTIDDSGRAASSTVAAKLLGHCVTSNLSINTKTGIQVGALQGRPSQIRISSLTQTANYSPCIEAHGAGTELWVSNFSPNGSTATPITIDDGVRLKLTNAAAPSIRKPHIYVKDEAGVLEAWHRIALGGDIKKSSVARTGGAAYSLKFTFDQDANERRPLIFGEPGSEVHQRFLPAGSRTLTWYAAHKGLSTSLLGSEFWAEIEYYDGSSAHRALGTTRNVAPSADASTWVGDSGLTKIKLVLTITVGAGGALAPIRFYYRHYDASGILYLDPACQVT